MPAFLRWLLRLGPTNPIAVRLVQGGSRRTRHLYIRTAYLAVLIAVLMWVLLIKAAPSQLNYRDLAAAGASSFIFTAYFQVALICLLAPVFMSGAIAQEANPKTWDILLTTPLSAVEIVLGNLIGRLFFVLALLFASLPLFAVVQYFGGAPSSSIFASYAIAACAALLVGATAITLSVSRWAGKRALFTFIVGVVSYLAITGSLDLALRGAGQVTVLTPLNPFLALESLLAASNYRTPDETALAEMGAISRFWFGSPVLAWCMGSSVASAAMVILSSLMVRRVGTSGSRPLWRRALGVGASGERRRTARTVWHNPVAWREAAARSATLPKIIARWSFVAAGLLWGLGLVVAFHRGFLSIADLRFALLATVWAEVAVIALVAINMAATAVSREREDGTLDLLLITPITASAYLMGKLRGLISYLAPMLAVPTLTVVLAALYVLAVRNELFLRPGGSGGVMSTDLLGTVTIETPAIMPVAAFVAPLTIVPFIAFCVIIGLQWSLKSKGTIGSIVATFGVVVAISGVVGMCGWKAGAGIEYVGPALACLNPVTAMLLVLRPAEAGAATLSEGGGLSSLRAAIIAGSLGSVLVYAITVYGIHATMVRTFDMTVRRLAGTR